MQIDQHHPHSWHFILILEVASSPGLVRAGDWDGDGVDDAVDVCCQTLPGVAVDETGRPVGDLDRDCDVDLADVAMMQQGLRGPAALGCCENGDCDDGDACTDDICDLASGCRYQEIVCDDLDECTDDFCDPQIDAKFDQYEKSASPQEREKLLNEIQQYLYDNLIFVPLYRLVNISAGPEGGQQPGRDLRLDPAVALPGPLRGRARQRVARPDLSDRVNCRGG